MSRINTNKELSSFENSIWTSLLFLWASGFVTLTISTLYLPSSLTGFSYSRSSPQSGLITFLLISFSILGTITVWSFSTFRHRAQSFAEDFDQQMNAEKLKSLHAAKLSALGQMAAGVAHEINNPLAIMGSKVKSIGKALPDNLSEESETQLRRHLQIVQEQVERIARIVESLKSMTADGSRQAPESIALENLIEKSLGYLETKIQKHQVQLQFLKPLKSHIALCRPTEISQIIYNLASNAIDAIDNRQDKWLRIELTNKNQKIVLRFSDSGGPLDAEFAEKIMEPFFTTKEVGKGTGLGLSICRSMAENNQGQLYYDSDAPTTTFVLELPEGLASQVKQDISA